MADMDIISLDVNIDSVEDFEILPKSGYPAECVVAEIRTSDGGNDYLYTNWRIDPSDYPADYDRENAPEGTVLNYSRVQVPQANDRRSITALKKLLRAMGLPTAVKTVDPATFVGQKAKIVVVTQVYQGEKRNSIQAVESLDA